VCVWGGGAHTKSKFLEAAAAAAAPEIRQVRDAQPVSALQRHAEPPEGAPVQGAGYRRPRGREDVHHPALRPPDLLHQLPGHHRRGLRPEGVELGLCDCPAPTVGHCRWAQWRSRLES